MRKISLAFLALSLLVVQASVCGAADKKQLADALAAVEANLKTPAGKQYDDGLGKELSVKYLSSLKQCKQSTAASKNLDPFDMFIKMSGDGKVQEVLVYPETPMSMCARSALLAGSFSPPPHGDYWVNIHMQPKP